MFVELQRLHDRNLYSQRVAMVLDGEADDFVDAQLDLLYFHILFAFRDMICRSGHASVLPFTSDAAFK